MNTFSFCSNVIFAGALFLGELIIRSYIAGQKESLLSDPEPGYVKEAEKSELAHAFYQAINRGTSRIVLNGKAKAMNVWLIHKRKDIRPLLNDVMPGVKWGTWETKFIKPKGVAESIAHKITQFLSCTSLNKISSTRLKKDLNMSKTPRTTFSRAVKQAIEGLDSAWYTEGYSLVRRPKPAN